MSFPPVITYLRIDWAGPTASPEMYPKFQIDKEVYTFPAGSWNNLDVHRLAVVPLELAVRAAPIAFLPAPVYGIVAYMLREVTASLF